MDACRRFRHARPHPFVSNPKKTELWQDAWLSPISFSRFLLHCAFLFMILLRSENSKLWIFRFIFKINHSTKFSFTRWPILPLNILKIFGSSYMVSIFIKLEIYEKIANNVKENCNIRLFLVGKQFFHVVFCACVRN